MKNSEQGIIQIEDLLCDEIMRTHLGKAYNKALMMHQLQDPTLMGLDLDKVCEMDMEMLISDVLLAQDLLMTELTDFVATMEIANSRKELEAVKVYNVPTARTDGEALITISFDKSITEANIYIEPPEEGAAPPTEEDIRTALLRSGVVYGIKEDYIARLVERPIYKRKIKIAQGKAPAPGIDGKVTYSFNVNTDLMPQIDERGIADYKDLNFIHNVKQGDLLCDIVRSTVGVPGVSVCGDVITGRSGTSSGLVCGVNTILSDDRTKLYASCNGQVFLKGKTVYVRRTLTVDNVNSSTGNILFVGSVHVRGDVASGFSVRAGGNITIDGVAENAVLVSGNNISISDGIKGSGKALIVADGNVRAFYIENARIQAKGNVYADTILNSSVESARSVHLLGKCGRIIGGSCTAGETILANQIGNEANLPTNVSVSDPDTFGKKKAQNMLTIAKYKETIARLNDVAEFAAASHLDIAPPEVMLCRAVVTKIRFERAIDVLEMENAETDEQRKRKRRIEVSDVIFQNVSFTIDGITYKNDIQKPGCVVSRIQDRIVFRTY
ncbi:MAG: FapA family protein [Oscillospiraceae bacterium]